MSPDTRSPVARHPDAEELAAFVDGRLSGAARDRMVAHLADCAQCHGMMVDVVTVLRDPALADEEDDEVSPIAPGKVLRPPAGRFRRALPLVGAVAAAALVALLVSMIVGRWILAPAAPATVTELLAPFPSESALSISVDDIDHRGWPRPRGEENNITPTTARNFQLGMLNADLQIARAAGDADTGLSVTDRITKHLEETVTAGPVLVLYASEPTPLHPDPIAEADRYLAEVLATDPPWYALGRWAGVASEAADVEDLSWFVKPDPRRTLRTLRRHDWPPEIGDRLETIHALVDGGVATDELPALESALSELITLAGGGRLADTRPATGE